MNINLEFNEMIAKALAEWPEDINVSNINNIEGIYQKYKVDGLDWLLSTIDERCIGIDGEVLWRDLHNAICEAIAEAAKYVEKIETKLLRKDLVKLLFEKNLKSSASGNYDLNWNAEDYVLVELYFSKNKSV